MVFHIVGAACVAASLSASPTGHARCTLYEDMAKNFATIAECQRSINSAPAPLPAGFDRWVTLRCSQVPETGK